MLGGCKAGSWKKPFQEIGTALIATLVGVFGEKGVEAWSCPKNFVCEGNDKKPLPGYTRIESGKDELQWQPGSTHPDHDHIVAAETELYWIPEPGYSWTSGKTKSERRYDENNLDVQWKPGSTHPNHNHVVTAETEGFWRPELGYRWYCSDGSDRHRDGDRDGDSSLKVSEDSSPTKDTVTLKEAFTRQKDTVRLSCLFLELSP
jgi:hypothetical protein